MCRETLVSRIGNVGTVGRNRLAPRIRATRHPNCNLLLYNHSVMPVFISVYIYIYIIYIDEMKTYKWVENNIDISIRVSLHIYIYWYVYIYISVLMYISLYIYIYIVYTYIYCWNENVYSWLETILIFHTGIIDTRSMYNIISSI